MGFKVAIVLVCLFALTAARNFLPFRGMSPLPQNPVCIVKHKLQTRRGASVAHI